MLEIGLTGGIGSGKSTVAEMLVSRGMQLVDADAVVRELQQPGTPVLEAMADRFGNHIIDATGALDRAAVAAIVFSDPDELEALNAIVHPAVNEEMTRRRKAFVGTDETVILDIPLLIESNYEGLGGIIVVDCPVDVAVNRLMSHRNMPEEDARNRINAQVSRKERKERADFVVDNSSDLVALIEKVDELEAWIKTLARPDIDAPIATIKGRYQPARAHDEEE